MTLQTNFASMSIDGQTCPWLEKLKSAEKTSVIQNGTRKVHYKFADDSEMAEEYNMQTGVLVRRVWKRKGALSKEGEWDVEVGDPEPKLDNNIGIKESHNMPYVLKRITKQNIEWRIRNLPYPVETYSITATPSENCITVRTTNKKYFKKLPVPDLQRIGLSPKQENISHSHKVNVLIITYKKPKEVLEVEERILSMIKSVKTISDPGQLPCNPS